MPTVPAMTLAMADYAHELAVASAAARAAGDLARGLQGGVSERRKSDGSPVSDADLAADAMVRHHLVQAFPDDAILSEEVADAPSQLASRLACRRLWIIDPIDGTRDFLEGGPDWAVQIALAVDGDIVLGVLAIPVEGVVVAGALGSGAWCSSAAGDAAVSLPAGAPINRLITSRSKRNLAAVERVRAALPEFAWLPTTSIGVKVWRMLQGRADLFVHARGISEWDVAAPAAVLAAAGGTATDLAGRPLRYNTPTALCPGLVFSTRADHGALVRRIAEGGVALAG